MSNPSRFVSIGEAAKALGVSIKTLRRSDETRLYGSRSLKNAKLLKAVQDAVVLSGKA